MRRPLRRFEVLRGAGLGAARSSVSDLLTPFSVTPLGTSAGAEVLSDVSAVRLGPVSLVYARNTGAGLEVQLARPLSVRRVIELVEREPAGDLSLARLAAVAGMGPRALQRSFREYVGVSPREYVQRIRLGRAHEDLAAGAGGTVAEIAFRWGFTHVPRFAGAYQERYGMRPSVTLQTARAELRSRNGSPGR